MVFTSEISEKDVNGWATENGGYTIQVTGL